MIEKLKNCLFNTMHKGGEKILNNRLAAEEVSQTRWYFKKCVDQVQTFCHFPIPLDPTGCISGPWCKSTNLLPKTALFKFTYEKIIFIFLFFFQQFSDLVEKGVWGRLQRNKHKQHISRNLHMKKIFFTFISKFHKHFWTW